MKAQSTKGPWRIEDSRLLSPTKDDGWETVLGQINQRTDVDKANGILICAAPDLLNACVEVNNLIASGKPIGPKERFWILTTLLHATLIATEGRKPAG